MLFGLVLLPEQKVGVLELNFVVVQLDLLTHVFHAIQLLVEDHIVQGPDWSLNELCLVNKVVGYVPYENVRVKVRVKLFLSSTRCCLVARILAQLILLAFKDFDVEVLVVRAD